MSKYTLYNKNNLLVLRKFCGEVDTIYADCIYEELDFSWIYYSYHALREGGILYAQTDFHSVAEMKVFADRLFGKENLLNWLIYKQEWGGVPRNKFPQKHDDILMYVKGNTAHKFYRERIMIPKVTAGTALDKRGDGLKVPCSVFDDLGNFHTTSKERVKMNGKNIQWQKPLKLINRLLLPVTDAGDLVVDPFMGSGTTGVWCKQNNRNFVGVEIDPEVFKIARQRIEDD